MSYQTALTIAEVIDSIHKKKYLLPAIQREFVWNPEQIGRLCDSLMRDYPISSFLFWHVSKDKVKEYEFYEFLREYHEKHNVHNPKANVAGDEEIVAVLDGQQRLTSLYVALKGSYAYKIPRKRWDNPQAFPTRKLYLNLLKSSDDVELKYDFKFLTDDEASQNDTEYFWFPVGQILDLKQLYEVNQYMIEKGLFSEYGKEKASFANQALSKLHEVVHLKPTISYYLEKSEELDKVLNIFIRINSGGTILSYSDLLLSIATAQWEEKDAREEITGFVDELNGIGDGFSFNKDFVLKACLVLSDFSDIAFKVDNFNKSNMLKIESRWDEITRFLRLAVGLVSSFGYSRETLTSNNAVIPIAYYLYHIQASDSYVSSSKKSEEKTLIRKWLVLSLIKRAFSGQPDSVLRPLRRLVKESSAGFPLQGIIDHFKGTNKSLIFSDEDIENLLWYRYSQGFTFSVLSLIYPHLDYRNVFHVDHIFPRSLFTKSKLMKRGVAEEKVDEYKGCVDYIGNLQLLEAIPNIEKSDNEFGAWFTETFSQENDRHEYRKKHLVPDMDYSMTNFLRFYETRRELLQQRFKEVLQLEKTDIPENS